MLYDATNSSISDEEEKVEMDCIIVHNDIVTMSVDAIVLPSNTKLTEGPGASAAIFAKAGKSKLQRACKEVHSKFQKKHWGLTAGKAVVTQGFGLDAKYIIHAIVPKWVDGKHNEYASLSATYISALALGDALGCESLAFPLLASGHNGYNLDIAFQIAEESIKNTHQKPDCRRYIWFYTAFGLFR